LSAARGFANSAPRFRSDEACDVIIVGYGGAGAAAAITASDCGAEVLVIEKQSLRRHTSNTQLSLGVFLEPANVADARAYMDVAARVNVEHPDSRDIEQAVITAWASYGIENRAWLTRLGAPGFVSFKDAGRDIRWPGNEAIKVYHLARADGSPGYGHDLFALLDRSVATRRIPIRWNCPATHLITNAGGEVVGVRALYRGRQVAIRARRAVVLALGGFEHDAAALRTFLPIHPFAAGGNPGNTGDGLPMVQALGAALWHMAVMNGSLKMKFSDWLFAFEENFASGAFMAVDRTGRRFRAETALIGYSEFWNAVRYDTDDHSWPRIPVFYVFDESRRRAGPIVFTEFGAAGPAGPYRWSRDNRKEIARGWILRARTVEALAERIGLDRTVFMHEIARFNAACRGKLDWLGRDAATMAPIERPPFYAVPLWPGLNNTFGGPRRNARAQVMHVSGAPIPRLYAAGEFGSILVQYPQSGANLGECIIFGRIAGENAARESPISPASDVPVSKGSPRRRR
jgi:succinate dehydrogenase/fumarate reductase flavoprotein subunit